MPKFKENIYIPVWIDLKGDENYEQICAEHNLHSSMDRFEENKKSVARALNWHLHSSMDRFEASLSCSSTGSSTVFTFQYG